MPTSEYDPNETLRPATPDGYAPPTRFDYRLGALLGIVLVVAPVSALAFGALLWYAQGPQALAAVFEIRETPTSITFTLRSAAGDVYIAAHLLRMPPGTLLYDSDVRNSFVYYPADASNETSGDHTP
ncbi:MAG: hypothetical protein ABEJ06_02415 [Haloarculaceae archaeon]